MLAVPTDDPSCMRALVLGRGTDAAGSKPPCTKSSSSDSSDSESAASADSVNRAAVPRVLVSVVAADCPPAVRAVVDAGAWNTGESPPSLSVSESVISPNSWQEGAAHV